MGVAPAPAPAQAASLRPWTREMDTVIPGRCGGYKWRSLRRMRCEIMSYLILIIGEIWRWFLGGHLAINSINTIKSPSSEQRGYICHLFYLVRKMNKNLFTNTIGEWHIVKLMDEHYRDTVHNCSVARQTSSWQLNTALKYVDVWLLVAASPLSSSSNPNIYFLIIFLLQHFKVLNIKMDMHFWGLHR